MDKECKGDYSLYAQPSYPNTMYNTMNPMTTGYGMGMDSFGAGHMAIQTGFANRQRMQER